MVSSSGVGDASCQSSTGSSSMASRTSSSMNHIRLVMHSQRSLAVPHITQYGPLDHWAQLYRALARAKALSLLVSQMSQELLRSPGQQEFVVVQVTEAGRIPPTCFFFSNWAAGSQKPTACLLACCCMTSLMHPWFRVSNSGHQLGGVLIP